MTNVVAKQTIILGDCLEKMKDIPSASIDMILADLPYGTTQNKWDSIIPLDKLWEQYKRIIKLSGAIILTAQSPFDKVLGVSNLAMLKYEWIWQKEAGTGFLNAKKSPLKDHENVLVFYSKQPTYNPQYLEGRPYTIKKGGGTSNYNKDSVDQVITENDGKRYPKTIIQFSRDKDKIHPTQKPVALFEYLIKTYTNEGETVLDNTAGVLTTCLAASRTNRNSICIEKELDYINKGLTRLVDANYVLLT